MSQLAFQQSCASGDTTVDITYGMWGKSRSPEIVKPTFKHIRFQERVGTTDNVFSLAEEMMIKCLMQAVLITLKKV